MTKRLIVVLLSLLLLACASTPPKNQDNLCSIFYEKDDWYGATLAAQKKWGTPIAVQMAIIHQESRFQSNVRPPRDWFLGFVPLPRSSSAYGYGQAQDSTWDWYMKSTDSDGADRDDFADVADFIGWYTTKTQKILKISKKDAFRQYIAYHEGWGNYKNYKSNNKIILLAKKVEKQSSKYKNQLSDCQRTLSTNKYIIF